MDKMEFYRNEIERLVHPGKEKPFILQIGANDGITNDPVYPVVMKHGLPLLAVEPQPRAALKFKENYQGKDNVKIAFVAAGIRDEKRTIYYLKEELLPKAKHVKNPSGLSSFTRQHLIKAINRRLQGCDPDEVIGEMKVQTRTIESLIQEYGITRVDVLQIDIEGHDWEIIQSFDFEKYRPALVNYETFSLPVGKKTECRERLEKQGYKLHPHGYSDILGIRQEDKQ